MKLHLVTANFFMLFFCIAYISAQDAQKAHKGFSWELSASGDEVYITGYTGTDKKIRVPGEIEKKPVTAVSGFANNADIVSIEIPDSVKRIKQQKGSLYTGAFSNCAALKSVSLPKDLEIIEAYSFSNCPLLEDITLEENITFIGSHSFADCFSLKKITLPPKIKKISWAAFIRCKSLETIEISDGLTEISYMAFSGCTALKAITFPKSLLHIGQQAFENCSALSEVVLESENIDFHDYGNGIFSGCANLPLNIRQSISEIGYTGSFD
ncbi:MAG: hypothetical protein Ta2B_15750 [Termitinemataceae bacterium]|nr:MAG: hypothetical protein Ta2B_15750 [Termitinemataceae bacterium]